MSENDVKNGETREFHDDTYQELKTDKEYIRTCLGMYISKAGTEGAMHLLHEIFNNAIDEIFKYYNNDIGDYLRFLYDNDEKQIIEIETSTGCVCIDGECFKFYSKKEYIKERLLVIESEKSDLEKELKELRKQKISTICVGKNYSIVYLTNEKQIIIGTCTSVNASFIRIKTAISGISYEISVNNILEIEAKEDIDNIFKNLLSIVENEEIEFFNGYGD